MDDSQDKLGNSLICLGLFFLWFMVSFAVALFPAAKLLIENGYDVFVFHVIETLLMGYLLLRYRQLGLDVHVGSPDRGMFLHFGLAIVGLTCITPFFAPPEAWVSGFLNYSSTADMTRILTLLVIAPIGEEIVFRGFLLQAFLLWGGNVAKIGIAISAGLFAMVHWQYTDPISFVSLFMSGVLLAYARIKSNGLLLPVTLHMLINGIGLLAILTGNV